MSVFLDPLLLNSSFAVKKMFGGLAVYFDSLMVLVLTESPGDRTWAGKKFSFDIWNGVLLCTDDSFHSSLLKEFDALTEHPVIKKWLYLPAKSQNFEKQFEEIVRCIAKKDNRIGVVPSIRKRHRKSGRKTQRNKANRHR